MRRIATIAAAGSLLVTAALPATTSAAATTAKLKVRVVAAGLNAPKQLTFANGGVYVAESGTGGPVGPANCVTGQSVGGAGLTKYCEGHTGAIAFITATHRKVILGGLPSVVEEDSGEVSGPSAVAFGPNGAAVSYQDLLLNSDGSNGLTGAARSVFGTIRLSSGRVTRIARYDAVHPQRKFSLGTAPGELAYDSDPYDVVAYRGGYVVADAAANALLRVSAAGRVSLLARFPTKTETVRAGVFGPTPVTMTAQAVPTSVAVGPDGAFYVGLLRGVPCNPGTAAIYRVVPGHGATVWARGLTAVTAIAFDGRGRLLATELSTGGLLAPPSVPGALVRIGRNGKTVTTLPVPGLVAPTGVAVGAGGTVYVSNYGTSTRASKTPGEILQITGLG